MWQMVAGVTVGDHFIMYKNTEPQCSTPITLSYCMLIITQFFLKLCSQWHKDPLPSTSNPHNIFNLQASSQPRVLRKMEPDRIYKSNLYSSQNIFKKKSLLKGWGTNYIRHNTLKICIEITNQTCLHDSKVQNTTLKGVQTALLYITVWVAENVWTFRKHKPNLFWFFLLFVCLYHHLSNTQRIHVHDPFMHAFTQEENTPTAKWVRDEGKVGYLPLPEGCWNLGRQDCAN